MLARNDGHEPLATLKSVTAFRTIYALCDLSAANRIVRATHYATCLIGGRAPLWGVFSAQTERLTALFDSRDALERHYPKKIWRVRQTAWQMLGSVTMPSEHEARVKQIEEQL